MAIIRAAEMYEAAAMTDHVETLRRAYQTWHDTRGANRDVWLDLVSDDFEIHSVARQPKGLSFAGDHAGRRKLDYYLRTLIEKWEMRYYRVDALFGDESRVVMFGECSYNFRANGETVTTPIAALWRFKDGKASSCIEVFDSADANAKASMPPWGQT